MKKPLLLALVAALGFLVWRYTQQRAVLATASPTLKPDLKANQPNSELLALFPKAINAIFGQPTSPAGVAPGTTYDPEFVRDSYDWAPDEYLDYEAVGIY